MPGFKHFPWGNVYLYLIIIKISFPGLEQGGGFRLGSPRPAPWRGIPVQVPLPRTVEAVEVAYENQRTQERALLPASVSQVSHVSETVLLSS